MEVLQIWVKNLGTKKDIRRNILKARTAYPEECKNSAAKVITEKLLKHPWFRNAEVLYCYVDFRGEVSTRMLIEEAWRLGKKVCVPKVFGDDMKFFQIQSFEELAPGTFGVPEPVDMDIPVEEDGLMIMPGAAFDLERNRIGYGRGYYDRYLSKHSCLHTIAIAYDLQIVPHIEAQELDIRPELIITETRQLSC